MRVSLVMTIIGPDRPGLVGRLSAVIADHGGNWLESRMAHLGGQFAGILRVELPADHEAALLADLRGLDAQGLTVTTQRATGAPVTAAETHGVIEVVGHDRPGIIRQISQVLAEQHVNVEELTTFCESAPMSGEQLFHATAAVRLSTPASLPQLQRALEQIASDLMVDVTVTPA